MKFLSTLLLTVFCSDAFANPFLARNLAIQTDAAGTKITAIQLTGLLTSNLLTFAGTNTPGLETKIYRCPNSDAQPHDICLYAVVTNNTGQAIDAKQGFYFPDLRGLKAVTSPADETTLRMSTAVINPFEGAPFKQEYAGGLYQPYALRWIDFGGYASGLSVFQEAWGTEASATHARPSLVVERTIADPTSLRVAWKNNLPLAVNESWVSDYFLV